MQRESAVVRKPTVASAFSGARTAEDALRAYADELPLLIWEQDASGAVCFTNAEWHRVTGLPNDAASHTVESWKDVVHPDDLPRVLRTIAHATATRASFQFEWRGKRADAAGGYRWYFARAVPHYEDSEFAGWTGACIDVHDWRQREETERKLREEAIESKHVMADSLPVIVWTADASGWIDWYSRGWYDYTGQTPEQAAGWGWQAAHHPEDFLRVMEEWPRSIETGEPFEMEFRLRRHDGVFRTFLTRIHPFKNERGAVLRWYGSNVDIQEQKDALARTERVAETLQGVFLPGQLPRTDKVRIDAVYQAAEKDAFVGGDWFDAIRQRDGSYLISMGDVAGHGLDASVIAGRLRTAIRDFALSDDNPAEVLRCANHVLGMEHPGVYATAIVGFIDSECTRFWYASAGHPAPMLARSKETAASILTHGGLPLGIVDDLDLVTHRIEIKSDDVLALYTDGLTEFARDIPAAEENLAAAVSQIAGNTTIARPAAFVRDALLADRPSADDIALLIVQFSEVTDETLAFDPSMLTKTWRFHSSDAYTAHMSRLELAEFLRRLAADPEALFSAELIIGEILANTVEHAPGLVEIHIDWTGEKPVITARDTGPGLDHLTDLPEDAFLEDGRGLFLIKTLAEEVTITPSKGYGTELRAVLPLLRAPALSKALEEWGGARRSVEAKSIKR